MATSEGGHRYCYAKKWAPRSATTMTLLRASSRACRITLHTLGRLGSALAAPAVGTEAREPGVTPGLTRNGDHRRSLEDGSPIACSALRTTSRLRETSP